MKRIALLSWFVALAIGNAAPAFAQQSDMKGMDMKSMDMKSGDQKSNATHNGTGIVKEVNTKDGAITFSHDPIKSLNWPAMTMAFKAKDKQLLSSVKPGDKVDFTLVKQGNDYVVTSVKPNK